MRLIDADAMMQRLEERLKELDKEGVHIAEDSNGFFDILIDHLMLDSEIRTLREWINKQPTIEAEPNSCKYWDSESHFCALHKPQAEPVRRGRWSIKAINTFEMSYGTTAYEPVYECSVCGGVEESYLRLDEPIMPEDADFPRYCPNCGAKMEEWE